MNLKNNLVIAALVVFAATLTGCNDIQKYLDKMHLTKDQLTQAKPIFEEHAKKQNKILEEFKTQMSSGKPSGGMGGAGGGMGGPPPGGGMSASGDSGNRSGNKPDMSKMKEEMEKKKSALDEKFNRNDQFAIKQLEAFLSEEQIEEFKIAVKEIREEKMKELMSQQKGPGGQGGPGGGMGGPGGGMGRPGGMNF